MERLGVAFTGGMAPTDIVECVRLAEELGYESAWMAEGHGGDQFSILTACAVATKRILLGTSITSVFVRTAPTIAMAAACVDHFSNGRFVLGLGTSHQEQVGPEHGLEFDQPVQRLRECIDVVRGLLRDCEVSYRGDVIDIERFDLWFEPLRRELPIYLAGVFPKMLELCGELSDGALLTWCTLDHARLAAEHVAAGARRAGKKPSQVEIATMVSCAVGDDRQEAEDSMRGAIASYAARLPRYRKLMAQAGFGREVDEIREAWLAGNTVEALQLVPVGLIEKMAIAGSAAECRARLDEYRQAGITLPIVSPRVSGPNARDRAMEVMRACAPR